jgi:hypothetical protein
MNELAELARKFKASFPLYAKNVLRIINKDSELVPFTLNRGQQIAHTMIERQYRERGKVRALMIKARQVGMSTYTEGRYFWRTTGRYNASAFVLAHLSESTSAIFKMVRNFYDNIPHPAFKPGLASSTATSMVFEGLNSAYRVGTARSTQVGRGQTNHYIHCSEAAFYPQAEEIIAGLLQSVPQQESEVIVESTANGAGGWFYDQVMKSARGEGEWITVFVPWFWMPEYAKPVDRYFEATREEEKLAALYTLTPQQLMFRRSKVDELGSTELFLQEYPSNIDEAFRFSGHCFVEETHLATAELECYSPIFVGDVCHRSGKRDARLGGPFKQFQPIVPSERYCIGADIAEGLSHGDYSSATVLDSAGNQVASWHGHIDPLDYGDLLFALGQMFNKAFLIPERNNHGLATVRRLQERGYPNIYHEQTVDESYADRLTRRVGFLTTSKTKPLIIDGIRSLLRQGESGLADKEYIGELRTYVVDEKGVTNAKEKCHDDRVMSWALAIFGLNSMPRTRRYLAGGKKFMPGCSTIGY